MPYKGLILERFEMLVKLCEETEPDIPNEKHLFSGQLIAAKEMYDRIETGVSVSENEIPQLMKQANKIWRIRNKVKNGEWDHLKYVEMTDPKHVIIDNSSRPDNPNNAEWLGNKIRKFGKEQKLRFDVIFEEG